MRVQKVLEKPDIVYAVAPVGLEYNDYTYDWVNGSRMEHSVWFKTEEEAKTRAWDIIHEFCHDFFCYEIEDWNWQDVEARDEFLTWWGNQTDSNARISDLITWTEWTNWNWQHIVPLFAQVLEIKKDAP